MSSIEKAEQISKRLVVIRTKWRETGQISPLEREWLQDFALKGRPRRLSIAADELVKEILGQKTP